MCLLASVCLLWRNIYVDLPCRFLFMLVPTLLLLCSVLGWSFCEEEGLSLKSCTWLSNTAAWGKLLSFSKSRFSRLWSGVHFINFVGAVWAYTEKTHIMHLESGRYAVNMAFFSPVAPSVKSVSCSLVSDSATVWTVATRPPCPWDCPGKNAGVGCHSLLQGIFPTQRSNPGLLHCSRLFTIWATKDVPL